MIIEYLGYENELNKFNRIPSRSVLKERPDKFLKHLELIFTKSSP
jgi:hypothetical protein